MLETFIFILGLLVGSFINVCVYRLPRKQSIVFPSSHCPSCREKIRPYDNIPLLSFIFLRGRCRSCRAPIPWRYPLVEALHGLGYLLILRQFGFSGAAVIYALFFSSLVAVTFIDLSHQIVPDVITLPGMIFGLIAASTVLPLGPLNSLIGLFLGGALFYLVAVLSVAVLKKDGMGGGDIKLIAMIGAFLGWRGMLLTIFLGALAGSLVGLFLVLIRGRSRAEPIPFGPFLSLGAMIALFWGGIILNWYFNIGRS
ncbi:MAG TPA: prepilin peptidase [Candidatus Manganitrophaceae bacterium]|nr:prepilin peptidase [Candidatus Manganitrophaceae bacterium]